MLAARFIAVVLLSVATPAHPQALNPEPPASASGPDDARGPLEAAGIVYTDAMLAESGLAQCSAKFPHLKDAFEARYLIYRTQVARYATIARRLLERSGTEESRRVLADGPGLARGIVQRLISDPGADPQAHCDKRMAYWADPLAELRRKKARALWYLDETEAGDPVLDAGEARSFEFVAACVHDGPQDEPASRIERRCTCRWNAVRSELTEEELNAWPAPSDAVLLRIDAAIARSCG